MRKLKFKPIQVFAVLLAFAVIVVAVELIFRGNKEDATIADMSRYLLKCGWETEPQPVESRIIEIPKQFGEAYTRYNDMQKSSGFDLSKYRGKKAEQYTFKVTNHEQGDGVFAEIIIYKGDIIGGDLFSYSVDGFISPLS